LGGATETPILILRIAPQLCATAPRFAASASPRPIAASATRQIEERPFDIMFSSSLRPTAMI
jgi:hypothetical protein